MPFKDWKEKKAILEKEYDLEHEEEKKAELH